MIRTYRETQAANPQAYAAYCRRTGVLMGFGASPEEALDEPRAIAGAEAGDADDPAEWLEVVPATERMAGEIDTCSQNGSAWDVFDTPVGPIADLRAPVETRDHDGTPAVPATVFTAPPTGGDAFIGAYGEDVAAPVPADLKAPVAS